MKAMRRTAPGVGATIAALIFSAAAVAPVAAAAPANDDISSPTIVGSVPYTDGPYDTTEATSGTTDPGFCYDPTIGSDPATVWYSFTPAADGRYLADTFGSDYDTTLYVGTANGSGGVDVIDCNDDSNGLQSAVSWDASSGTTYLIMVGTCCGTGAGGGGSLTFHVSVAPPAPKIDIVVAKTGSFNPYGVATIRGSATCTDASGTFEFEVIVSQAVGRHTITGGADGIAECSSAPTPWSVDVTSPDGKLLGGKATVQMFAFTCGPIECAEDDVQATVRLSH
jgi:hypothetical protein